jgi:hypothetical protein
MKEKEEHLQHIGPYRHKKIKCPSLPQEEKIGFAIGVYNCFLVIDHIL